MMQDEYQWFKTFKERNDPTLTHEDTERIALMYSRIFERRNVYRPCKCNPREWQRMINELTKVYQTYQT